MVEDNDAQESESLSEETSVTRVGVYTEISLLFVREMKHLIRDKASLIARFGITGSFGLFFGLIYLNIGEKDLSDPLVSDERWGCSCCTVRCKAINCPSYTIAIQYCILPFFIFETESTSWIWCNYKSSHLYHVWSSSSCHVRTPKRSTCISSRILYESLFCVAILHIASFSRSNSIVCTSSCSTFDVLLPYESSNEFCHLFIDILYFSPWKYIHWCFDWKLHWRSQGGIWIYACSDCSTTYVFGIFYQYIYHPFLFTVS